MANEIVVDFSGKLDKIQKSMEDLAKMGKDTGNKLSEEMAGSIDAAFSGVVGHLSGIIAGLAGSIVAAFSVEKMIESAIEGENALNQLTSAMVATGTYTAVAAKDFEKFAASLQQTTIYSHQAIEESASSLITLGRLSGEALDKATKAAVDFAAGMGKTLPEAFNLIAKAAAGSTTALTRYGIVIDQSIPAGQRFNAILDQINQRFAGFAEGKVNTFAGSMAQLRNSFNDFTEKLGDFIIKSPVVVALVHDLASTFEHLAGAIGSIGSKGDVIGDVIKQFLNMSDVITEVVIKPLELLFNMANWGWAVFRESVGAVMFTLAELGAAFADIFGRMITGVGYLASVLKLFNKQAGEDLSNNIKEMGRGITQTATIVSQTATATLNELAAKTNKAATEMFNAPISNSVKKMIDHWAQVANAAKPVGNHLVDNLTGPLKTHVPSVIESTKLAFSGLFIDVNSKSLEVQKANERFVNNIQAKYNAAAQNFAAGFARSFSTIGEALVKGSNVFQEFGKVLLGLIGDMAIQVGTAAFLMGLATYNYGQAGLGLALIVLGGALKALGSGGGGGSSGVPDTGGGGGSIGSSSSMMTQQAQTQPAQQTQVQVHVAGNVFDNRQTGLAIVDAINDAFQNQGAIIAQKS